MEIRSPTHELTRAQAALRARRLIANAAPDWALSPQGLEALRGAGASRTDEEKEGRAEEGEDAEPEWLGSGALDGELAAVDRALARSSQVLAGGDLFAKPLRAPLLSDPDGEEDRLEAWQSAAAASASDPPCIAAALLWNAWEQDPPLERQAWLGNLLVAAHLRSRRKTRSHHFPLSSALHLVRYERRRSADRAIRLGAFLEALAAGAEACMKDHDRLLLIRQSFEGRLEKRRGNSRLPALAEFIMTRPVASAGMIAAALSVTPRAVQEMVKELGLRELTGCGRYRAWGIL
jgi:hypothetical protein